MVNLRAIADLITQFLSGVKSPFSGVAESGYECQLCIYPKVSLSLGFKNPIKEVSSLKSAKPAKRLMTCF
jgi:hypothetical protein